LRAHSLYGARSQRAAKEAARPPSQQQGRHVTWSRAKRAAGYSVGGLAGYRGRRGLLAGSSPPSGPRRANQAWGQRTSGCLDLWGPTPSTNLAAGADDEQHAGAGAQRLLLVGWCACGIIHSLWAGRSYRWVHPSCGPPSTLPARPRVSRAPPDGRGSVASEGGLGIIGGAAGLVGTWSRGAAPPSGYSLGAARIESKAPGHQMEGAPHTQSALRRPR